MVVSRAVVNELSHPDFLSRVARARHLASWVGRCPGNNASGGTPQRGQTRPGSPWRRQTLREAAPAAARCQQGDWAAQYQRVAARRGKKKAVGAVGHRRVGIVYAGLTRREEYRELGGHYCDARDNPAVTPRLVPRLQKLGYAVSLQPAAIAA